MIKTAIIVFLLLIVLIQANNFTNQEFAGYYQSWTAGWQSDPSKHSLARMPAYVTVVNIAFANWNLQYTRGKRQWGGTGIDFNSDFDVVAKAIQILKQRTNAKVLISVGGATYTNYKSANFQAAADLVADLGLDGIDIDFEPNNNVCTWATGGHSCPADNDLIWLISSYRKVLPRPKLLTVAGWSTGAFGAGDYPASKFPSKIIGANFGLFINALKAVGTLLDAIFIMSYDASADYPPKTALDAYRSLFKGPLLLGVEIPPEAWGGHVLTLQELDDLNNYVKGHQGQGIMLWSLQKQGNPSPTQVGQKVCTSFGLRDCNAEIPSN